MGQGGKYFIDCGCLPRPIIVPHPNRRDPSFPQALALQFLAPQRRGTMGLGGEYFKVGGSSFGRSQSRTPTAATRPSRKL